MILRIDRIVGLCTAEAESLLVNRFSPEIALQVRESLWDWLRSQAALPGPRLADAASGSSEVEEEEEEDDDYDDDDDYDGNDDEVPAPFIGHDPASPISVHGLRPAAQPRESLPAVEAPPQDGDALERWADRYGVRERLADRLDLEHVRHSYYGFTIAGLPATIREAVLVTQAGIKAPRYFRSTLASDLVGMAKSHLHRAAQTVAIARRRLTERAARALPLDDPYLLRFENLIRQQRDLLAAEVKPRPAGTYLPGRIYVNPDALVLTYREWDIHEGRTPNIEGETMFFLHLSA